MTHYFIRLPVAKSIKAALDATAHLALRSPATLHECASGVIVGCVELVFDCAAELEARAAELAATAEGTAERLGT